MSKIINAKGRDPKTGPSGYERLFGCQELGQLLSKCQATVISSGNELEKILESKVVNSQGIAIGSLNKENRIFRNVKTDVTGKKHNIGIDVVINRDNMIKLIELKDGDVFDVKKVAGELESLKLVKNYLIDKRGYTEDQVGIYFCSFNQEDKDYIYRGAKELLPEGSAMTGRELCKELGIDYDLIIKERKQEQPDNLEYFLQELIKIPIIKGKLQRLLKQEK